VNNSQKNLLRLIRFPSEELAGPIEEGDPMAETKNCPKCGSDLPRDAPSGICPKCLMQVGLAGAATVDHEQRGSSPVLGYDRVAATVPPPSRATNPQLEKIAPQFPQLEILELLGRGGMGVVYKARQRHLNRLVAVKILPPSAGADPAFAERFTREAQALAQLNHPNIVQVYDFGRTDEFFYFIMEFVDGANLRTLIRDGHLEPAQALKIVPQICEALQFAHDEGIVHRDIKPENILIDKRGRVKIADFGLAKLLGRSPEELSLTGTGQLMGTLGYMAPEQLQQAHSVDHRADIYSLGVVFYEMLTGKLPIGRFDPPSKRVQVDMRLDEIVLKSLETEPGRRYQHVSEIKQQVDQLSSGSAPPVRSMESHYTMHGHEHSSWQDPNHWLTGLLGIDPQVFRQLVHGASAVLGAASGLFFIAMAFGLMKANYALFAGIACGMLAGLVGSLSRKPPFGDPHEAVANNTKLQAALAMSAGPHKDQTLAKVAKEAAEEGENTVALVAIQAIENATARDEAAARCALQIAENEGTEAALPVARMIEENNRRNDVLQKLVEM
jgi:predicted Ser/Thr protein kinase